MASDSIDHGSVSNRSGDGRSADDGSVTTVGTDERRYRKLIENIQDTVTVVDATGAPIWTSASVKGDLGYVPQFWEKVDLFELVHPDDKDQITERLAGLLGGGDSTSGEVRLRRPTGDYSWVAYGAINRLADPDVGGIVITARPIDSEVEARRLQTARNSELEKALATRSQFIAGLSHELRSPLHAIIGLSEILQSSTTLTAEEHRHVESITQEATALRVMIDSLLDFSKIDAKRMDLLVEPFSPAAVIDAVGQSHLSAARAKGLNFGIDIDAALPHVVLGDEHRLRQILVNLVTNAIKYTDTGRIDIVVSAQDSSPPESDDGSRTLSFVVTDTGAGIPPDAVDTLFEPYRQVRASDTTKGTGLGLAITKSLVELMEGTLTFESDETGTSFICQIPFRPARRASDRPSAGSTPAPAPARSQNELSVLVVDDSEVNQMLARSQLERLGHLATVVSGGLEALEVLGERTFDLVLMDWHMPGIDGLETTRRIRQNEGGENPMVIIATTASATSGDREACLDAGMDDYLAKPISLTDLSDMIGKWGPTPTNDEAPVGSINDSTIDQLVADLGDPTVVATVISTFLDELDRHCAAIEESLASDDRVTISRSAHTLKSTASMLGAADLAKKCADLEAASRTTTASADELATLAAELASHAEKAAGSLAERRERLLTDKA